MPLALQTGKQTQQDGCTALASGVLSPVKGVLVALKSTSLLVGLEPTSVPPFLVGLKTTLSLWESTANRGERPRQSRHRIAKEFILSNGHVVPQPDAGDPDVVEGRV